MKASKKGIPQSDIYTTLKSQADFLTSTQEDCRNPAESNSWKAGDQQEYLVLLTEEQEEFKVGVFPSYNKHLGLSTEIQGGHVLGLT